MKEAFLGFSLAFSKVLRIFQGFSIGFLGVSIALVSFSYRWCWFEAPNIPSSTGFPSITCKGRGQTNTPGADRLLMRVWIP